MITKHIRTEATDADLLDSAQRVDVPPQLIPCAIAPRQFATHKETEIF
jgi:hypothetical protein